MLLSCTRNKCFHFSMVMHVFLETGFSRWIKNCVVWKHVEIPTFVSSMQDCAYVYPGLPKDLQEVWEEDGRRHIFPSDKGELRPVVGRQRFSQSRTVWSYSPSPKGMLFPYTCVCAKKFHTLPPLWAASAAHIPSYYKSTNSTINLGNMFSTEQRKCLLWLLYCWDGCSHL